MIYDPELYDKFSAEGSSEKYGITDLDSLMDSPTQVRQTLALTLSFHYPFISEDENS